MPCSTFVYVAIRKHQLPPNCRSDCLHQTHFKEQPDLDEVAEKLHLSPFHFQRLFTEWAGVSPKKFVQYLSVQYGKTIQMILEHLTQRYSWEELSDRININCFKSNPSINPV